LAYEYGEAKSFVDFHQTPEININTSEIFTNIFEEFYTFPTSSRAIVGLEYNNVPYEIAYSNGLIIDPKIRFIKEDYLFSFFIQNRKVTSFFQEFDRYFKFVDNFRLYPSSVPVQLVKRFENRVAGEIVSSSDNPQSKINENKLLIEKLQIQQKAVMSELDAKQEQLKEITERKQSVMFAKNNVGSLAFEKERLENEYKDMSFQANDYLEKLNKVENLLKEIDLAIQNSVDFNNPSDVDIDTLKYNKNYFEREKQSLQNNYAVTSKSSQTCQANLQDITAKLTHAESFIKDDIKTLDKNIQIIETEREELYTTLEQVSHEIKNYKKIVNEDSLNIEKSKSLMDVGIADIEKQSITEILTSPTQPSHITTVMNYLRYVFVYEAEKMKQAMGINDNVIICRQVLTDVFGLYFQNAFIATDYKFNRHDSLIRIK
jgi:predicted  nucleic acid-binding Zn-ribbon protein